MSTSKKSSSKKIEYVADKINKLQDIQYNRYILVMEKKSKGVDSAKEVFEYKKNFLAEERKKVVKNLMMSYWLTIIQTLTKSIVVRRKLRKVRKLSR